MAILSNTEKVSMRKKLPKYEKKATQVWEKSYHYEKKATQVWEKSYYYEFFLTSHIY